MLKHAISIIFNVELTNYDYLGIVANNLLRRKILCCNDDGNTLFDGCASDCTAFDGCSSGCTVQFGLAIKKL